MDLPLVVSLYLFSGLCALALRRPLPRLAPRALRQPPLSPHQERVLRGSLTLYGVGSLATAAVYALHWGFLAWCLSLTITVIVIVRSLRAQTPRPRAASPSPPPC